MKIEFIDCDLPCNYDSIRHLSKYGTHFFILCRYKRTEFDYKKYKEVTILETKIGTLEIHPNVSIMNHDFFRVNDNCQIIGYCPLEFP